MPKRKSLSVAAEPTSVNGHPMPPPMLSSDVPSGPPPKKRATGKENSLPPPVSTNPDKNDQVLDSSEALRASPDADDRNEDTVMDRVGLNEEQIKESPKAKGRAPAKAKKSAPNGLPNGIATPETEAPASVKKAKQDEMDPEADEMEEADEEELKEAVSRPPPVNSDYLPLPWKGRLGYACLCTYLRFANPPVFSSRTCRIASILENRHPLKDPNAPPHPTKNRPDKDKPADVARGQAFVEALGKANAKDIVKMLRWNDRYGIKFLRLSSEMFPFASHAEYGYRLAPFVSEELKEAGRVAAELGHRLTTHPGQYTQLGSPRKQVIDNALRDLEYHAELLDLLKLPPQQDRDAVMILHLGGVFGDKEAALDRFRTNYARLPANVKKRLVLENDDVSWSVHDLLPLCEELNIPMVLDFHHHNIIFDADKIREGTKDIVEVFPRIIATWRRKQITPKMHYSEPTPAAITGRQRRKHNPRVATLPPCPDDMDLMIEAKDKEQAVFELMRTFKLPGHHLFADMIPHVRGDENKPPPKSPKAKGKKGKKGSAATDSEADEDSTSISSEIPAAIPDEELSMGGPDGRVYWPPGMEHWLRPMKKERKPAAKGSDSEASAVGGDGGASSPSPSTPLKKGGKGKKAAAEEAASAAAKLSSEVAADDAEKGIRKTKNGATPIKATKKEKMSSAKRATGKAKKIKEETPFTDDEEDEDEMDLDEDEEEEEKPSTKKQRTTKARASTNGTRKRSSRGSAKGKTYAEDDSEDD